MLEFARLVMAKSMLRVAAVSAAIALSIAIAHAQTPASDAEVAARELMATMKVDEQFKLVLPMIVNSIKPAIVQNRPEVDRDFDAFTPQLLSGFQVRLGEYIEAIVKIYAANYTADELRAASGFCCSPAGQKFVEKTPLITQQTMAMGRRRSPAAHDPGNAQQGSPSDRLAKGLGLLSDQAGSTLLSQSSSDRVS